MHTHRAKEHKAGECDDPEVPFVDYVATIELDGELTSNARASEHSSNKERTRRPSANQLVKGNIALGMILITWGPRNRWYPYGPGGPPFPPRNSRLSMKEMDWVLRFIAVFTVINENMTTV